MENSLGISELSREQYHKDGYNPSLSLSLSMKYLPFTLGCKGGIGSYM
jgi:hypothetical protein